MRTSGLNVVETRTENNIKYLSCILNMDVYAHE